MEDLNPQIAAAQAHVLAKAGQDAGFRTALIGNPRATVEQEFGFELPAHIQIQVNEAPANTIVLSLPHVVAEGAGGELSDDDLEAVAGGSKAGAKSFATGFGSFLGGVATAPTIIIPGAGPQPVLNACARA